VLHHGACKVQYLCFLKYEILERHEQEPGTMKINCECGLQDVVPKFHKRRNFFQLLKKSVNITVNRGIDNNDTL
jgi:hypothetical protein